MFLVGDTDLQMSSQTESRKFWGHIKGPYIYDVHTERGWGKS